MLQGPKYSQFHHISHNNTPQDRDIVDVSSDEDASQTTFTTEHILSVLKDLKIGSIVIAPSKLVNCSEPSFMKGKCCLKKTPPLTWAYRFL